MTHNGPMRRALASLRASNRERLARNPEPRLIVFLPMGALFGAILWPIYWLMDRGGWGFELGNLLNVGITTILWTGFMYLYARRAWKRQQRQGSTEPPEL